MKHLIFLGLALAWFPGLRTLAAGDATIANLQSAWKAEMNAGAAYTEYAAQAQKEGYAQVALMFNALARSESIHAANHKTVLSKLGQAVPDFKPAVEVRTTKENLASAIDMEGKESMDVYPGYISTAKTENQLDAAKSMRWAMETGKKHLVYLQNALQALNANTLSSLPKIYWVCPKCGNTYNVPKTESMCSFCGTESSRFIKFK